MATSDLKRYPGGISESSLLEFYEEAVKESRGAGFKLHTLVWRVLRISTYREYRGFHSPGKGVDSKKGMNGANLCSCGSSLCRH
jgi:hypothetical protein